MPQPVRGYLSSSSPSSVPKSAQIALVSAAPPASVCRQTQAIENSPPSVKPFPSAADAGR